MRTRLLINHDIQALEDFLLPYKAECMFMASNLKASGIDYHGADFQGEYFGCFERDHEGIERLVGVVVHYWNGNVMMHVQNDTILEKLIIHLKKYINRPIAGILGPNIHAERVIDKLGLSRCRYAINRNEGLYELNLSDLSPLALPPEMRVVPAQDVPKNILIAWLKNYDIEALGAASDETLEKKIEEHWDLRLRQNNSWVLLHDDIPVALGAFNARLADRVQVGPVYTPPDYRNLGFARRLLAHILYQEKLKGTHSAVLFTDNPAAIKAYRVIGFKKIGDYRIALLERSVQVPALEFTLSPAAADVDFLTQKINLETPAFGDAHPFAFVMRDHQGQIIAGCNGSVIFGSIYTDQLWVHPDYRQRGFGRQLMEAVHAYGRQQECAMATVATMSFQGARSFYEKLGYVSDFERPGYADNTSCIYLKLTLLTLE